VPNLTLINNGTFVVNGTEKALLQIEVLAGPDSLQENLKFEWLAVNMTSNKLFVQLTFDSANWVSAHKNKDLLVATFNDLSLFTALNGKKIKQNQSKLNRHLPAQLT